MSAVYFAKAGDYVKIGFASNPTHRAKHLLSAGSKIIVPAELDRATPVQLILVIPFCRMRDERNMQMLFAAHWVEGEWYRWSPAFEHQMRTMQFVTHGARLLDLRRARRELGIIASPAKAENWGKTARELLTDLRPESGAA